MIITSDHGEAFGYHAFYGHGGSLYLDEIAVPLVILSPKVPQGTWWPNPSACRDLPQRLSTSSVSRPRAVPRPQFGSTLEVDCGPGTAAGDARVFGLAHASAFRPQIGPTRRGVQMSLVASDQHYVREGTGTEQLFNLVRDPFETTNLANLAESVQAVGAFRRMLLKYSTTIPGQSK